MSGDQEQEYFADGISEDIITGLSKLRWFFVIARNSSFTYKGAAVDVKRVARELGVRYVLEGSVRKGGNRVRITAQLIDAATSNHIWADRYDGDLTDIFALQDEITKKVVAAIEPKLLEAEGIRSQSRSPEDLGAWDMVMQANSLFWRLTKDEGEAAIAMLRRAVERYPDYAPAHSMLAFMLLVSGYAAWTLSELEPQVRQAETLATRAATLDDSDPWAHLALGYVAFTRRQHRRGGSAIPTLDRSEPELRCCSRLFWLGPCARWPIGPSDTASGAGHPHEPARSAKRNIFCGPRRRALPDRPIQRSG